MFCRYEQKLKFIILDSKNNKLLSDFKDMEEAINDFLSKNDFMKIEKLDEESIKKIYDFYFNGIISDDLNLSEMFYYGIYYEIKKNEENMVRYYLMAILDGNPNAMFRLGFYCHIKKDYDSMLTYYQMAINKGNIRAMYNLGFYYYVGGDVDNMLKYYLMAINRGNPNAMVDLGDYYQTMDDKENMVKYYLMNLGEIPYDNAQNLRVSQDESDPDAMYKLGTYYKNNGDKENMVKYYLMGANKFHQVCIDELNENLKASKNITHLIKCKRWLDNENRNRLEKEMSNYENFLRKF